jgi:hypothetical protein
MQSNETWEAVEGKMLELRILTDANWKNGEYELAALGERVLRSVEIAKSDSEKMVSDYTYLEGSIANLKHQVVVNNVFASGSI